MGSIVLTALGIGLLIFVHELGHFAVAKLLKIKVEAFSMGFGPFIHYMWRGTDYRLSLIPLGGYVKLAGEEPDPTKPPSPEQICNRPPYQRAMVFVAGAAVNIFTGFLLFILAFGVGVPKVPSVVGDVEPGSPAWHAGIERGDVIVGINKMKPPPPLDFEDLQTAAVLNRRGRAMRVSVERAGEVKTYSIVPEHSEKRGFQSLGLEQQMPLAVGPAPRPRDVGKDEGDFSAIYKAGLQEEDVITAVQTGDGPPKLVHTFGDFGSAVALAGDSPVRIRYQRDGQAESFVEVSPQRAGKPTFIGIQFGGTRKISAVRPDSWAEAAGFKPQDEVLSVAGKPTASRFEVIEALAAPRQESALVEARRGEETIVLTVGPLETAEQVERGLAFDEPDLRVADCVLPDMPAHCAGMKPGDRLLRVNGKPLPEKKFLGDILSKAPGKPVNLTWSRDGKEMSAQMTPEQQRGVPVAWKLVTQETKAGLLDAVKLGWRKEVQWIVRVYLTIRSLILADLPLKSVSSILGIAYMTYVAAETSFGKLIEILAVLSVNFGVMNLLPMPVLDGGHLLFLGIEKVRGKALSEKTQAVLSYIGLGLLLTLLLFALKNDIQRFILG